MAWSSYAPLMGMSNEPKVHVCAQAQNPKVSTGDAQKVVTIISGDRNPPVSSQSRIFNDTRTGDGGFQKQWSN
jgi:hypothetical protein